MIYCPSDILLRKVPTSTRSLSLYKIKTMKVDSRILFIIISLLIGGIVFFLPVLYGFISPLPPADNPPPDLVLSDQEVDMDVEPATSIRTNDSIVVEFFVINYENSSVPINCSVETELPTDTGDHSANITLDPKSSGTCIVRFNASNVDPGAEYDIRGYVGVGKSNNKQLVRREVVLGATETAPETETSTGPGGYDYLINILVFFGILTLAFGSLIGAYLMIVLSLFNLHGSKIYESEVLKRSLEAGFGLGATLGIVVIGLDGNMVTTVDRLEIHRFGKLYLGLLAIVLPTGIVSGIILLIVDHLLYSIADVGADSPDQ